VSLNQRNSIFTSFSSGHSDIKQLKSLAEEGVNGHTDILQQREELLYYARQWQRFSGDLRKPALRDLQDLLKDILEIDSIDDFVPSQPIKIIIPAAGFGSRLKGFFDGPKALLPIKREPIIFHILNVLERFSEDMIIVVRPGSRWQETSAGEWKLADNGAADDGTYEEIRSALDEAGIDAVYVGQTEQKGDGHAVLQAAPFLEGFSGNIIVCWGDMAMLNPDTVLTMIMFKEAADKLGLDVPFVVATVVKENPYAPILRNSSGKVVGSKKGLELALGDDDVGVFFGESPAIMRALRSFPETCEGYVNPCDGSINDKGELNFIQIVGLFHQWGREPVALAVADIREYQGINVPEDVQTVIEYRRQMDSEDNFSSCQPSYLIKAIEDYFNRGQPIRLLRSIISPFVVPHELGNLIQAKFTGRWQDIDWNESSVFSGITYRNRAPPCHGGITANVFIFFFSTFILPVIFPSLSPLFIILGVGNLIHAIVDGWFNGTEIVCLFFIFLSPLTNLFHILAVSFPSYLLMKFIYKKWLAYKLKRSSRNGVILALTGSNHSDRNILAYALAESYRAFNINIDNIFLYLAEYNLIQGRSSQPFSWGEKELSQIFTNFMSFRLKGRAVILEGSDGSINLSYPYQVKHREVAKEEVLSEKASLKVSPVLREAVGRKLSSFVENSYREGGFIIVEGDGDLLALILETLPADVCVIVGGKESICLEDKFFRDYVDCSGHR
ncbi:MAG: NTP transferase domain-containing protein, partial [Candidatus Omnitrophica bacterium]|nr:NTP transferase domain-containing protein [Candidatus Omnitrophota bacterium]